jgi:hypothetical protein
MANLVNREFQNVLSEAGTKAHTYRPQKMRVKRKTDSSEFIRHDAKLDKIEVPMDQHIYESESMHLRLINRRERRGRGDELCGLCALRNRADRHSPALGNSAQRGRPTKKNRAREFDDNLYMRTLYLCGAQVALRSLRTLRLK